MVNKVSTNLFYVMIPISFTMISSCGDNKKTASSVTPEIASNPSAEPEGGKSKETSNVLQKKPVQIDENTKEKSKSSALVSVSVDPKSTSLPAGDFFQQFSLIPRQNGLEHCGSRDYREIKADPKIAGEYYFSKGDPNRSSFEQDQLHICTGQSKGHGTENFLHNLSDGAISSKIGMARFHGYGLPAAEKTDYSIVYVVMNKDRYWCHSTQEDEYSKTGFDETSPFYKGQFSGTTALVKNAEFPDSICMRGRISVPDSKNPNLVTVWFPSGASFPLVLTDVPRP